MQKQMFGNILDFEKPFAIYLMWFWKFLIDLIPQYLLIFTLFKICIYMPCPQAFLCFANKLSMFLIYLLP